jgi:hypothetical protein
MNSDFHQWLTQHGNEIEEQDPSLASLLKVFYAFRSVCAVYKAVSLPVPDKGKARNDFKKAIDDSREAIELFKNIQPSSHEKVCEVFQAIFDDYMLMSVETKDVWPTEDHASIKVILMEIFDTARNLGWRVK